MQNMWPEGQVMRSTQNVNICCGSMLPVLVPLKNKSAQRTPLVIVVVSNPQQCPAIFQGNHSRPLLVIPDHDKEHFDGQ